MERRWSLICHLNDTHTTTVWNTQEGAIADRERQLKPKRVRDYKSPTGYKLIWPIGWTAINKTVVATRH